MAFEVANNIKFAIYEDGLIVFDPNSGQTHNLDSNSVEIIDFIKNTPKPFVENIIEHISNNCTDDEKTLLYQYIQDIINNLIQLNIIKVVECN